jgi:PAS domain S-box-containing protein
MTETYSTRERQVTKENVLRLLVIDDSFNDTQSMIRILRNSGYAVHQATPGNSNEIVTFLQSQPIDLAICSIASTTASLEQAREAINACGRDIPLIALAADQNGDTRLDIMQTGACDLVRKSDLEHLQLVIRRELASLENRRKLALSEQLILESETRCRALLDHSQDAIAYVHDGMHIRANAVYCDLFGFKSLDEIESTPVMDVVAPQDHAKLKEFLRLYRSGEEGAQELQILALRPDGTLFSARMLFTPAAIEGEPCTQIIIRKALSAAKLAGEQAGQQGNNELCLFDNAITQQAAEERDQHWIKLIRNALGNNRFKLVYQPIASLHHDTSEKYEVFVRMRDEEGKELLPGQFIPVAEQNSLLAALDRWVILNAVKTVRTRRRAGLDAVLFVKVSPPSIDDETLLPWLNKLLEKALVPGDRFVFELSEEAVSNHFAGAKKLFKGLQKQYCGFCLEHFGNSGNAFQLLQQLPAAYLKIDASITRNLATSKENQALIKSIVETAQSMDKMTIAPHVEDASSLALLWQAGVDYIQGHFLQQPNSSMNFDFEGGDAG